MNKKLLSLLIMATVAVFTANCSSDDEEESSAGIVAINTATDVAADGTIGGNASGTRYNANVTITASAGDTVTLSGLVRIGDGATLTVPAGVTIEADSSLTTALVIEQGGTISAIGNASNPIVFTSDKATGSRTSQDWGGIVIQGYSETNNTTGLNTATDTEIGTGPYGGDVETDNSGTLQYVRIEFAGKGLAPDQELNGLFLAGVGSGTTIDHVQVNRGSDDGIEIFGGSVDLTNIVLSNNQDDQFDLDEGWRGTASEFIILVPADGDQAIEYDGLGADADRATDSTFTYFSMIGAKGKTKEGIISIRKSGGLTIDYAWIGNAWGDFGVIAVDTSSTDNQVAGNVKLSWGVNNEVAGIFKDAAMTTAHIDDTTIFCQAEDPSSCTSVVAPATAWPDAYTAPTKTNIGSAQSTVTSVFADFSDIPTTGFAFENSTTWADNWTSFPAN